MVSCITLSTIVVILAASQNVVAFPTSALSDVAWPVPDWPIKVNGETFSHKYTPHAETNAERMKRGAPLAKPVKLFGPTEVHSAPQARLSSAPGSVYVSGDTWFFEGCYPSSSSGTNLGTITASSPTDAVTQCVSQGTSANADDVAITQTGPNSYSCYNTAGSSSTTQETCTDSNAARYSSS